MREKSYLQIYKSIQEFILPHNHIIYQQHMGLDARKAVFGDEQTTKAQTSVRIRAVWWAPLLFAFEKVSYVNLLQVKFQCSG